MSLYDDKTPVVDPTGEAKPASQAPSEVDQLLVGIKNEKGEQKYSNVQEAIKGLAHAQEFINTLKAEQAQMREMLKSQEQLKELFTKPAPVLETKQAAQQSGLTPEAVLSLIETREKEKVETSNLDKVKTSLKEVLGAEYKEILKAKTAQLGLTPELVDNMAKTSPDALLKLFDVKASVKKPSLNPDVNTSALKPGEKPPAKKFDPYSKSEDKNLAKWRASVERTNARLGLTN